MSGHSKWANIKHKKGAADKKRGRIFSRITKEIIIAVKQGGADQVANTTLRSALVAARAANMPNSNIDRAIKKAAGDSDTANYEEILYEGYGHEGVAILVESLTDNRNRTGGEVRLTFDRNGGNMAGSGAVTWMFHRKSHFIIIGEHADEENLMELLIEADVEDIEVSDGTAEIWGAPDAFLTISNALEEAEITPEEANLARKPENTVKITNINTAEKLLKLIDKFEDLEDVQAVYANFDFSDEVLEKLDQE
ncbi:MAG: YebC/PmpR family DNA-binding transcriptional regulator [bacterium]|nr:YebC/PmpR family DNA-binding transcriptional regulator [bacterium]